MWVLKVKKLTQPYRSTGGRNDTGQITVRHRGGRTNKQQRLVDFGKKLVGVVGKIVCIQGDWCNRTGFIALVAYSNGYLSYSLVTAGSKVGDIILPNGSDLWYPRIKSIGSAFELKKFKSGDLVHSIKEEGCNVKYVRGAGTFGRIMKVYWRENRVTVRLPSGEVRLLPGHFTAIKGQVSHVEHRLKRMYKAGQNRWRGRRSGVRGVAMNPVDHPHGGRTGGGCHPVTPWGRLTRGVKTSKRIGKVSVGLNGIRK